MFLSENKLAEEGNDRILENYQGWGISNIIVGSVVGTYSESYKRYYSFICKRNV